MKNVFVGNMSFESTESGLRSIFEPFGEITLVNLITDRDTGRARGFGFVEMASNDDAQKAIGMFNGQDLKGRALKVNEAREREGGGHRPGNNGRGGGWDRRY